MIVMRKVPDDLFKEDIIKSLNAGKDELSVLDDWVRVRPRWFKKMVTQEQLNQVLPTFPSDGVIQSINQALKSGEYHIIITRMEPIMLDIIFKLRDKYNTSFGQRFFPFEEGITLADLVSRIDKTKEVLEHQMMITKIPKSIMTDEEVINAFLLDPKNREELVVQSKLYKNMTL